PTHFWNILQPYLDNKGGSDQRCTVSHYCFNPEAFVGQQLNPLIRPLEDQGLLKVFYQTVVKTVDIDLSVSGPIESVTGIRRVPKRDQGVELNGFDKFLSEDLTDWYSPVESARYTKEAIQFVGRGGRTPVVIEATEFGDVLALSTFSYLQGVEQFDGSTNVLDSTCGQATVFPFTQLHLAAPETEVEPERVPALTVAHPEHFELRSSWQDIWQYRRLGSFDGASNAGEVTMQNWEHGNDYPFGYLFLSKEEAQIQALTDWQGGINMETLRQLEGHAYGWHDFFKATNPAGDNMITMPRGTSSWFKTASGLSKLPYLRDTRRSIGIDDFVLSSDALRGDGSVQTTGEVFPDRVALGAYIMDFHSLTSDICALPEYVKEIDDNDALRMSTLPFYIPFRALTHREIPNMLVAGKTMAQSFVANAAIRLQPTEWSTGVAAGAAAAHMVQNNMETTTQAYGDIGNIQQRIRAHAPIDWTL
ncbi:MAG: FAD-dependent oxidoreductase, partial [Myxococcota bacterium]